MAQKSSFPIPINPTVLLVSALVLAMVFGNRWRQNPPMVENDDDVSERIDDELETESPESVSKKGGGQRYPELGGDEPTEPPRLHYGQLIEDAHPIDSVDVADGGSQNESGWITPPRSQPSPISPPNSVGFIRPPSASKSVKQDRSGPGSFVSLPGDEEPMSTLSAPITDSARFEQTSRESNWRPAESIAPGRAIPLSRLPTLQNSTEEVGVPRGTPTSSNVANRDNYERIDNDKGARSEADEPVEENGPTGLPPLIGPQSKYEGESTEWRPVALQTAAPAPPRKEQVEVSQPGQSESTEVDWDALESAKVARSQNSLQDFAAAPIPESRPAPLNPQAVRSSEATASRHLDAATQFASHRALAAANVELDSALRTIAAGADASSKQPVHVQQLAAGMRALSEAEDFLSGSAAVQYGRSARDIAQRHRTSVVRLQDREISATDAVEIYFSFAQQSILSSVGHSKLSSELLYQLGKVYTESRGTSVVVTRAPAARATLFHETALRIDPLNYRSANELAVLLAKAGQWDRAKSYLLHSLSVKQLPEAWFNLAKVHDQLGETELGQKARHEYQLMATQPSAPTQAAIQWVAPQHFESAAAPAPPPGAYRPTGFPSQNMTQAVSQQPSYPQPQAGTPMAPARQSAATSSTRWSPWRRSR